MEVLLRAPPVEDVGDEGSVNTGNGGRRGGVDEEEDACSGACATSVPRDDCSIDGR